MMRTVPEGSRTAAVEFEARLTDTLRQRGGTRRAADVARDVLRRESDWDRRIELFRQRTGARLTRQQLAAIAPLATEVLRAEAASQARVAAKAALGAEIKRLEQDATAGAHQRGNTESAPAIARAILTASKDQVERVELFALRTGVAVTPEQLTAIANLPDPARQRAKEKAKTAAKAAARARKLEIERRWMRGRRAAPGSSSVQTVSGGLPGLGRDR